jgi:hypothetical protein
MRDEVKIDKKDLNASAWIVIVLTYFLPYRSKDGFTTVFGYPIPFFTTYDRPVGDTLMVSNLLNIGGLAVNILIVYLIIRLIRYIKNKYLNKARQE